MAKEEIILSVGIADLKDNVISNINILKDTKKNVISLLNEDLIYRVPRNLLNGSKVVLNFYPDESDLNNPNYWLDIPTLEEGGLINTKEVKKKDELES